ncbi:MAG: hypothetical protein K8H89_06035 [Flavobacteriales bacterium]|jgi:hypothetical protein|nr:hypothetical protein [Flavobacteriales bacterium]MCB0759830.1 hypothetical protein [Flavobacteriales bacterium]
MKQLLPLLIGMLLGTAALAQKKELIQDKETILARAAETFDASLRPGGSLYEPVIKENLTGTYVLQVSFGDKGDISSVFVERSEGGNIPSQNRFKDLVAKGRMPFKMPKGRQYKLTHTFDLNAIER